MVPCRVRPPHRIMSDNGANSEGSLAVKDRGTNASVTCVASIRPRRGAADAANPAHRVPALLIGIKHALPRPGGRIDRAPRPLRCQIQHSHDEVIHCLSLLSCNIQLNHSCITKHSCVRNVTQGREKICADYVPRQLPMASAITEPRPDSEVGNSQFGK
jgi:hypothetical protein